MIAFVWVAHLNVLGVSVTYEKNLHIFFTVDLHLVLRRASSLIMDKTTWSLSCKF